MKGRKNMSFKENLLKKIEINQLAAKVLSSIGTAESGLKLDKAAMRQLLESAPYQYLKERDLDLYIQKGDGAVNRILVLDNELPIYETTVEDVLIRKSPYTKEMLSIKNIIKILKDSDVKLSRKEASLETVRNQCIDALDLAWKPADIEVIAKEGMDALKNSYADGVVESLTLFAELLGYRPPPGMFKIRHHEVFGAVSEKAADEILFGPAVVFSLLDSSLVMLEEKISSLDKGQLKYYQDVARGKEKAAIEGENVFRWLKEAVINQSS